MKEIIHSKAEYLEILLESPDGLTAKNIAKLYFNDVPPNTIRQALKRQHNQGLVRRSKEGRAYRYWITEKGVRRYNFLTRQ